MLKNLGTCTEIGYPVGAEIVPVWSVYVASVTVLNRPPCSIGAISAIRHGRGA